MIAEGSAAWHQVTDNNNPTVHPDDHRLGGGDEIWEETRHAANLHPAQNGTGATIRFHCDDAVARHV